MIAKYVAWREKDRDFNAAAIRDALVDHEMLDARLQQLAIDDATRARIASRIGDDFATARTSRA